MRKLFFVCSLFVFAITSINCSSVNGSEEKKESLTSENNKIEVYYFHYSRRCATCMAVETVTESSLQELYAEKVKNEEIVFKSINLDEEGTEEIAKKLEISGQTLLIVAGDKKENLTTDAFMNAKSNPEKLKEILKSTIDPLLEN